MFTHSQKIRIVNFSHSVLFNNLNIITAIFSSIAIFFETPNSLICRIIGKQQYKWNQRDSRAPSPRLCTTTLFPVSWGNSVRLHLYNTSNLNNRLSKWRRALTGDRLIKKKSMWRPITCIGYREPFEHTRDKWDYNNIDNRSWSTKPNKTPDQSDPFNSSHSPVVAHLDTLDLAVAQ